MIRSDISKRVFIVDDERDIEKLKQKHIDSAALFLVSEIKQYQVEVIYPVGDYHKLVHPRMDSKGE